MEDIDQSYDIWMLQFRRYRCFSQEQFLKLTLLDQIGQYALNRDGFLKFTDAYLRSDEHLAHADGSAAVEGY